MGGNQQVYDQAKEAGDNFFFDQDWEKAAAAYARALQEFPSDNEAQMGLGIAMLELKRYPEALRVFEMGAKSGENPAFLERQAEVLERLGRAQEAAQAYYQAAELYLNKERDLIKAIANWEQATRITPGLLPVHLRLAQAYERTGNRKGAIREYLIVAFNLQGTNDRDRALQVIERAKKLESTNTDVINAEQALRSGGRIRLPDVDSADGKSARPTSSPNVSVIDTPPAHPDGPLGEATENALAELAEIVFSDLSPATAHAVEGIELQKIDSYEEASVAYRAAESAGMQSSALAMCQGMMHLKLNHFPEAQRYFERANRDDAYQTGATHGMGLAYLGIGQQSMASVQLITALKMVDADLAMSQDEAAQLKGVWDNMIRSLNGREERDLKDLNNRLVKELTGPDWKNRIAEIRNVLATTDSGDSGFDTFRNIEAAEKLRQIDTYIKQGLLALAMDTAMYAIERDPLYFPAHQRIAQILMEEGNTQASIAKYNVIADAYLSHNDTMGAAKILNEVIKVAPMDIGLRTSLIELLERENKLPEMLDEYIGLANAHYQLADVEQARATYQEALRLAQRINAKNDKRIEILHRLADIDLSRLDLRQALRNYEQIRGLSPEDERARRALVDIHYRLNNPVEAVKELDALFRYYAQNKRGDQIINMLEQLVTNTPNDMSLRSRLAAVYRSMKRIADAIAQYDALGELQLEAGMIPEACTTVKTILSLGPSNVEQYQSLLAQLGC
jgi:tetratricopeptide (TPR) repeat protein